MFNHKILRTLVGLAVMCAFFAPSKSLWSNTYWQCTKEYTGMLADGAKAVATEVGNTLQNLSDAKEALETAQATAEGARYAALAAGAGAGGTTVAALESTAALAGAASEAVAATAVVAVKGVAVAGAAAVGTLGGQGLGWLISSCWDPVCGAEPVDPSVETIYDPLTDEELETLTNEIITLATDQTIDFAGAGDEGAAAFQFVSEGISIFLNAAQGAAAATAGSYDQTLDAVEAMEAQLAAYPTTISDFAAVLDELALTSPATELEDLKAPYIEMGGDFQVDWTNAQIEMGDLVDDGDMTQDEMDEINDAIGGVLDAVGEAIEAAEAVSFLPLVSTSETVGFFDDLTLDEYNQFIDDCATNGSDCLPPEEISIVEALMEAAGVTIPGVDIGDSIAEYDASTTLCDDSSAVATLQIAKDSKSLLKADDAEGGVNLASLLSQSVTNSVTGDVNSSWMNVDLEESPVTIEAKEATGETGSDDDDAEAEATAAGCSLIR